MSYNILNKNVNFQGDTQGTIEDLVDNHSTQTIGGLKTITHLTGTHVRVTNDIVALANISASVNISASAFYGDGSNISNVGAVTQMNNRVANRLVTIGSTTTELDGEANLTFDTSTKVLQVGSSLVTDTALNIFGDISASANVSGSAFYGSGEGLTGIPGSALSLASGGGIVNDSGLKLDSSVDAVDSLATADKILIFDAGSGDAVKRTTAGAIANLFDPAVSTFNGDVNNRVITAGGSEVINGEANLTFDDSTNRLTVTGDVSGSGFVSASIGHFVTRVESAAIGLANTSGIAGDGLDDNNGFLEVQVAGAVRLTTDSPAAVGISGSFAGNGLQYGGGVNSIDGVSIKLDSNSGLAVSAAGLKTNFAGLASATPAVASDNLTFIDSDGDKKCSFTTFLTAIAGANLGVSGSQLTASAGGGGAVSSVSAGANNRIATFSSADALNGEAGLTFDGSKLAVTGIVSGSAQISGSSLHTTGQSNTPVIFQSKLGTSGSVMALKYKEQLMTCGTDNNFDEVPNFLEQNIVPVALGIRVVQGMGNEAYITKIGTINDDDAFGVFANDVLETGGDNIVTSYAPGAGTAQSAYWYSQNTELRITYNATPASGSIRFGLYYYKITPPTA